WLQQPRRIPTRRSFCFWPPRAWWCRCSIGCESARCSGSWAPARCSGPTGSGASSGMLRGCPGSPSPAA
ncbi:MAG: Inner membrane protein, KefB/KefC family, partial [uncultured Microvirga sp.]